MGVTTEVAFIPLKADSTIEDSSSSAGKVWAELGPLLGSQPGNKKIYYGRQVENNNILVLFTEWDSVDSQKAWNAKPEYNDFISKLTSISSEAPFSYPYDFGSSPQAVTKAPVTEFFVTYFTPDYSNESSYSSAFSKWGDLAKSNGSQEAAYGWSLSSDLEAKEPSGKSKFGGAKGKAFIGAIGWPSLDAHSSFKDTGAFKDNVGSLREGPAGADLFHVKFA